MRHEAGSGPERYGERRRLDCLRAMGVDVWVSRARDAPRASDPGAADRADAPRVQPAAGEDAAGELVALAATVAGCRRCALHAGRTQTVFGVGDAHARCMVVGEAPGRDEDAQGEPFVGRAGRLLNAMLKALGFAREEVYIANIVKCRPPQNRDPRPEEVAACAAYLRRQIELVAPALILAVGRVAAQNLLGSSMPIGKLRGREHRYAETGVPVVVTYHPAYLLRSPLEKRKAWQDLVRARRVLERAA